MLSPRAPTVTLTRVQSGIGLLTVEAACSDAVGDLRLGAAWRLTDGRTSVVAHADRLTTAPAGAARPVLLAQRGRFETIGVDLRQVRALDRFAVYAFSDSGAALQWGGTLVVRTTGGSRVELPMDAPAGPGVVVLLTAYVVEGELVLRAEPREPAPTVREACLSVGYDRITWLDPRTPVS